LNIKENIIAVEKSARFFTNKPSKNIKRFLIVIHGYAQLASDFIEEFKFLDNENTLIVSPEGLSKFYFRDKIGASWMTKEDRENEIADYINYLNKVVNMIQNEFDLSESENTLLGFSQGVHTAARYFIKSKFSFNNLILCSSDFPKDADFNLLQKKSEYSKIYYLLGDNDSIIKRQNYINSVNLLSENKINFTEIGFSGGHKIDEDSLNNILTK